MLDFRPHVRPHGVLLSTEQLTQLCIIAQLYTLVPIRASEKLIITPPDKALKGGQGKKCSTSIGLSSRMANSEWPI